MEKHITILVIAVIMVVAVILVAFPRVIFPRSNHILESWAARNDYRVLSSELRWIHRGPFFWTTSKNQIVYYVEVKTSDDTVKRGWVRCGGWWRGVFLDKAEVRWDE
jgi:hypothetical protein